MPQQVHITVPEPGGPVTAVPVPADVPRTRAQLEGVMVRRSMLSEQVRELRQRREQLVLDRATASGERRTIDGRIDAVDQQLARLEGEIDRVNALVAAAPPGALTSSAQAPEEIMLTRLSNDIVPLVAILTIFVVAPFTLALSWFIWKRAAAPRRSEPAISEAASLHRLESLQQSVDAIAVEVERISEGQRFVTKVLNDMGRLPARTSE